MSRLGRSSDKSNPKIPSCLAHRWRSSKDERFTTASIFFIPACLLVRFHPSTEQELCPQKAEGGSEDFRLTDFPIDET
jgi:hypothetical protein